MKEGFTPEREHNRIEQEKGRLGRKLKKKKKIANKITKQSRKRNRRNK